MVLQSYALGNLITQFKKWVAPALRARYQREYFDQNLGWMEGRYLSWWKFTNYATKEFIKGTRDIKALKAGFLEQYGYTGEGGNLDQ